MTETPHRPHAILNRRKSPFTRLRIRLALSVACLSVLVLTTTLSAAPAFPLKVGPTGRYLVDQNGVPFLIHGDSPQALMGRLSVAEAEMFFAHRRSQGFNTVWINLLCATYIGCNEDGSTFDGIPPFNVAYDLSTPNEDYFARADAILRLAANHGLLVILDPAETGDWLSVLYSNGEETDRAYGQFLGRRYAGFDNIIWMHGNDYQDWGPDADRFTTAVARGIRDFASHHLQTVDLNFFVSSSTDDPLWIPLIDLNAAYTYEPVYREVLKDYNRGDMPVLFVEGAYEFENATNQRLRAQAYWALLSGATGHLYGNHYTWPFIDGWQDTLDSPGAVQMAYVAALFQSRPWWDLVPDQNHSTVISGRGDFGEIDYVTAARTPDGRLVMAYIPNARTVTVDMSQLSGPAVARWFDPASGTFYDVSGSAFPNAGVVSFTTPGDNADGDGNEDWVLLLEASGASVPSFIEFGTARDTYRRGNQIEVYLEAFNGASTARELYVGVLAPDGQTLAYFTGANAIGGFATTGSLGSLRPLARVAPGQLLSLSDSSPLLAAQIPDDVPPGVYTLFALLVAPEAVPNSLFAPSGGGIVTSRTVNLLP